MWTLTKKPGHLRKQKHRACFRYEEGTHLAGLNDLEGRGWRWPGKTGRDSDQRQTQRLWVMGKRQPPEWEVKIRRLLPYFTIYLFLLVCLFLAALLYSLFYMVNIFSSLKRTKMTFETFFSVLYLGQNPLDHVTLCAGTLLAQVLRQWLRAL